MMSLEKVYDEVAACMGHEPSEEKIQAFENQYHIKLPDEFRAFTMSPLGGLYMEIL